MVDKKLIVEKLDKVIKCLDGKANFDSLTQIESKEAKSGHVLVLVYKPNGTWDDDLIVTNINELLNALYSSNNRLFRHPEELANYKLIEIPKSELPDSWRDKIDYDKYPSFMRIDSLITAINSYQGKNFSTEDENNYYVFVGYYESHGDPMRHSCFHVGPMSKDEAQKLADDFRSKYKTRRNKYTINYKVVDRPIGMSPRYLSEYQARDQLQKDLDEYLEFKNKR